MKSTPARANRDQPPSTAGVPFGRASRWPLRAGLLAIGAIALAATAVAADPAFAPVQPTAVAAVAAQPLEATTTTAAGPTKAVAERTAT